MPRSGERIGDRRRPGRGRWLPCLLLAGLMLGGIVPAQPQDDDGAPIKVPEVGPGRQIPCPPGGCKGRPRGRPLLPATEADVPPARTPSGPSYGSPVPLFRPAASPAPAEESGGSQRRVRSLDGRMLERELGSAERDRLRKRKAFELALLQDAQVRDAYDHWASLDDTRRKETLVRVAELQARAYGLPPPKVVFESLPDGAAGMYKDGGKTIIVNDRMKYWADPDTAIGVVAHEGVHHYQKSRVAELEAGRLDPGSEDYALAQAWRRSFSEYCSPLSVGNKRQCGYEEYRRQSVEADAYDEQESATRYLRLPAARKALEDG